MLLAGWRAVREYDLKLILAFGTVSQLGLITVMVGAGGSDMMLAGLAMLCAHAMFKAALFMVVGIIDHATGTRDIRRLAWLGERSRPLLIIAVGATASMAALPPFLGFVAKEADFETVAHSTSLGAAAPFVLAGIVLGSVFTTIYSLRFLCGAFGRKGSSRSRARGSPKCTGREPLSFSPPAILAAAGLVFGLWPAGAGQRARQLRRHRPASEDYDLALWHGFGLPLLLSVLVLAVGSAAYFGRDPAAADAHRPLAAGQRRPDLRRALRGARPAVGAADRGHPARFDPGDAVGDPVHAGAGARDRAGARRPRPARVRAVGLAAAGRGRADHLAAALARR